MDDASRSLPQLVRDVGGVYLEQIEQLTQKIMALRQKMKETIRSLGIGVSPDECSLALRGFDTMGIRLAHVGRVSEEFAGRLASSPAVDRVLHPALPSCPGHEFWQRDIKGSSGVFSVVLKPGCEARLDAALTALRVFAIGASWGGTRSLIAPMSVAGDRTVNAWTDNGTLVRISIGLEYPADLWRDLEAFVGALGHQATEPARLITAAAF